MTVIRWTGKTAVAPVGALICLALAAGVAGPPSARRAAGIAGRAAASRVTWTRYYNGTANSIDAATMVAVSPNGKLVFVTGASGGKGTKNDYATAAYSAATGATLWVSRYNGPGNRYDQGTALAVSPDSATVFVTGHSNGGASHADYATVAYNAVTGARRWVSRYNGPANGNDEATAITVSADGSTVFVTGGSRDVTTPRGFINAFATVAYSSATGRQLWASRYLGPSGSIGAVAVAASPDGGTVFVTGQSGGTAGAAPLPDYVTIAYNAVTGAQQWLSRYNSAGDGLDYVSSLVVSQDGGTVFVTGASDGGGSADYGFVTIAYNAATGARIWLSRHDGASNVDDRATSLAVSPDGLTLFVTGFSFTPFTVKYLTIAYRAATGSPLWQRSYPAPTPGEFATPSLALGPGGHQVYVTGSSSLRRGFRFATVAYNAATGASQWFVNGTGTTVSVAVSPTTGAVFVTGVGHGNGVDYRTIAYRG